MCWTSPNHPVYKVAEQDIPVYKRFDKQQMIFKNSKLVAVTSLERGYNYIINRLNKPIELKHIYVKSPYVGYKYYNIHKGYHSWLSRKDCHPYIFYTITIRVVKCIIPKGSTYAVNEFGEVVSSNIVVTDEIVN